MKKTFFIIITLLACISAVNAQLSTIFGKDLEISLPKNSEYVHFLGADSDGFFALRNEENKGLFLDYFDGISMNKVSSYSLALPMISGVNSDFVAMFYIDSKLLLFTEVLNNSAQEKTLYMQQVNNNAQIIGEAKVIGKLTNQNTKVKYNICLTPNGQNVFVWYNRPFQTYNEEPFFFKVYDADMKEIYNQAVKLPLNDKSFIIDQVEIGNSGNVYMLAKISPDARLAQRMKTIVYDYEVLVFDVKSGNINRYEAKGKKLQLVDAIIGVDEQENVDIYGFMSRKQKDDYEAIMHLKLNTKEGKFIYGDQKKSDYTFSKTETPQFRAERLTTRQDQIYDYKLLGVVYLANGGSALIAEHQNYWLDSIITPQTREAIYSDYYRYNDVIVAYCSPENNMEWMTRVPKSQYSYNDNGRYSSVAYFAVGEKIFILYNDNSKNAKLLQKQVLDDNQYKETNSPSRNGVAIGVSIFSDGKVHGDELFGNNKKFKIIPEFVKEANQKYYMLTQNGQKIKFAVFVGR